MNKVRISSQKKRAFSLVQVILAAGLAAIVALMFAQMMKSQFQAQRDVKVKQVSLETSRGVGEYIEMLKENSATSSSMTFHQAAMASDTNLKGCLNGEGTGLCAEDWTPLRVPYPQEADPSNPTRTVAGYYTEGGERCDIDGGFLSDPPDFSSWKTNLTTLCNIVVFTYWKQSCTCATPPLGSGECECSVGGSCDQCTNVQVTYAVKRMSQL